jgi:acyl carrier protein
VPDAITGTIRAVLQEHGRLAVDASRLDEGRDLYAAGLTSHASVSVMLGLEERFAVEFPERMLRRTAFSSIAAIRSNLIELLGTRP